ncbi:UNVERIFIED_CONTAM: hypothetical protein Sradi_3847200 [Sesamum radiatum]|uniref:Uncharacterized protein n=1 Tax=Sesamum radiatum TaxID=300843 RepID=A0AAW2Q1K4_SESRA
MGTCAKATPGLGIGDGCLDDDGVTAGASAGADDDGVTAGASAGADDDGVALGAFLGG